MRERATLDELRGRLACLRADLYQMCGQMPVASLERLCRRIHTIEFKIYSFKGGRYGKDEK